MLDHWPGPLRRALFKLAGVNWAEDLLNDAWQASDGDLHAMLDWLFQRNRFQLKCSDTAKLDALPACIIAGNHPHGLFDGLALAWLASKSQRPTRVMARHSLQVFKPLQSIFLSVRPDHQRHAKASHATYQAALEWLQQGNRLVITPAASLSLARPMWQEARDPAWRTGVIRLALASQRPVVLVHVVMPNSFVRQVLHRVHPILRSLVQIWAYRLGRRQRIRLTIKTVVQPNELPNTGNLNEQARWLQARLAE